MENKPAFDRSLLIPIFIGFASVMGICLVLFAARFNTLRGAIQADETRTPVKYQYVATERATRVTNHMRQNGVLLSNSGPDAKVLKIRPPLVFEQEHAQMLVAALKQALQA